MDNEGESNLNDRAVQSKSFAFAVRIVRLYKYQISLR